jgi:hypothetical protein
MSTADETCRRINEWAAAIANKQTDAYFATKYSYGDPRATLKGVFTPKNGKGSRPFGLIPMDDLNAYLDENDWMELRQYAKLSVRQALADNPDLLAELITSYAAQGENFFEVFRR